MDAADDITVDTLVQILKRPGWLRLPLLVTVRGTPQGLVAELIYLLCHEDGDAAVVEVAGDTAPSETAAAFAWAALPPDVLRVLRAGFLLGTTFAADVIARRGVGALLDHATDVAEAERGLKQRFGMDAAPEHLGARGSRAARTRALNQMLQQGASRQFLALADALEASSLGSSKL